jgi:hypothetical protein
MGLVPTSARTWYWAVNHLLRNAGLEGNEIEHLGKEICYRYLFEHDWNFLWLKAKSYA